MKNKQREPKFELGQVVACYGGFKGVIDQVIIKNSKIKYLVSVDGLFLKPIKLSEKKLLKLNPISSKPKEPENELISSNIPWGKMTYSKLYLAPHTAEMNKKTSDSYKRLKHGDLVEVKHTGVRLYVNGVHSIGGLYDIGVDWKIDCDVVIKDIHRDSLILIKRNND